MNKKTIICSAEALPTCCFDYIRSFLKFKELCNTRVVSKAWKDISGVKKIFNVSSDSLKELPHFRPHLDNVVSVHISNLTFGQLALSSFFCQLVTQSYSTLEVMRLYGKPKIQMKVVKPLIRLKNLLVSKSSQEIFDNLITYSPNLKHLSIFNMTLDHIDFSTWPELDFFQINNITFTSAKPFRNISCFRAKQVKLGDVDNWNDLFLNTAEKISLYSLDNGDLQLDWLANVLNLKPELDIDMNLRVTFRRYNIAAFCVEMQVKPEKIEITKIYTHSDWRDECQKICATISRLRQIHMVPIRLASDLSHETFLHIMGVFYISDAFTREELETISNEHHSD